MKWVMPQRVLVWASWRGQFDCHRCIYIWRMVPLCLMLCISRELNARNFEYCEKKMIEFKAMVFKTLYGWTVLNNSRFQIL
jgi:hypothetical protein